MHAKNNTMQHISLFGTLISNDVILLEKGCLLLSAPVSLETILLCILQIYHSKSVLNHNIVMRQVDRHRLHDDNRQWGLPLVS